MRIIRGELAGKILTSPSSKLTRPTSDKVRQALFNILEHNTDFPSRLKGSLVLDAFAGTGALGLEALSRGANQAIFVDNQRDVILNLYNIIQKWNLKNKSQVFMQDVLSLPRAVEPVDFVFCDPPYRKDLVNLSVKWLYRQGWLKKSTVIISEMHKQDDLSPDLSINLLQERRYGDTKVLFFCLC